MLMEISFEQLKEAFTDVLDGNHMWYEIRENTGLPEARCKEISEIFLTISKGE